MVAAVPLAFMAVSAAAAAGGTVMTMQANAKASKTADRQAAEISANNSRVVQDTKKQADEAAQYAEQDRAAAVTAANKDGTLQLQQYEEERKAARLEADQQMALQQRAVVQSLSSLIVSRTSGGLDPYSGTGKALMDFSLAEGAADLDTLKANWGRGDKRTDLAEESVVQATENARLEAERTARNATTQAKNTVTAARNNATASNFQAFAGSQNTRNAANASNAQAIVSGVRGLSTAGTQTYKYFSSA